MFHAYLRHVRQTFHWQNGIFCIHLYYLTRLCSCSLLKLNISVFCNAEVILIGYVHKLNSMVYFMFMFYDLVLNICSEQTHVRQTRLLLGITHYWHMQINYSSLTNDARENLVGWLFNSTSTQKGQFVPTDARGKITVKFHIFPVNLAKFCVYFYGDLPIFSIFHIYNILTMFNVS